MVEIPIEQEDEDLFSILPENSLPRHAMDWFCSERGGWYRWEVLVREYLMSHGWKNIRFFTGDGDSFGPLIRVMVGLDPNKQRRTLTYG